MLFFGVVEAVNKFLGVFVLMLIGRILSVEEFIQYAAILVLFGYHYELAQFSFQNKNLIDMGKEAGFVYSMSYASRFYILVFLSVCSGGLFLFFSSDRWELNTWPLLISILFSFMVLEFYLYGVGLAKYIVVSRFLSQVLALFLLLFFYFFEVSSSYIFLVNMTQTLLLTALIISFSVVFGGLDVKRWILGLKKGVGVKSVSVEFSGQVLVFLSKILVVAIVTYEVALLGVLGLGDFEDMVLGNRIAIILLPFLYFYLNSNANSIGEEEYGRYIFLNFSGVVFLVFVSPVLVFFLLGKKYLLDGFMMNSYMSIIVFQAFVNYQYYFSIREGQVQALLINLLLAMAFSLFGMWIGYEFFGLSKYSLLLVFLVKAVLAIFIFSNVGVGLRFFTVFAFLFPVFLNFGLIELGYFEMLVSGMGTLEVIIMERLYES